MRARARTPGDTIAFEGPATIAAIILETIPGTAGIMRAAARLPARGPRALRPARHRLHPRRGHGRLRPHRHVVRRRPLRRRPRPDDLRQGRQLRLCAARRRGDHRGRSPRPSPQRPYPGGLTYSGHPLACAAAVATINAMEEEAVVEHAARHRRERHRPGPRELAERHRVRRRGPRAGRLLGARLVTDQETREPLAPYGGAAPAMNELAAACKRRRAAARS